jgi:hypothetical protein
MAGLPAICNRCKTIFPSHIRAKDIGSLVVVQSATATPDVGPCPNCGGESKLLPATHDSVHKAIATLMRPGRSRQDLEKLLQLLNGVPTNELNRDAVIDEIHTTAPKFSGLANLLPQDKVELYAFIGLLIAALNLALDLYSAVIAQPITDQQAQQIAQEAVRTYVNSLKPEQEPDKPRISTTTTSGTLPPGPTNPTKPLRTSPTEVVTYLDEYIDRCGLSCTFIFRSVEAVRMRGKSYAHMIRQTPQVGGQSDVVFNLFGKAHKFQAIVGLKDGTNSEISVRFVVQVDGESSSKVVRSGEVDRFDLQVKGAEKLKLIALALSTSGGQRGVAVWGNPRVVGPESLLC